PDQRRPGARAAGPGGRGGERAVEPTGVGGQAITQAGAQVARHTAPESPLVPTGEPIREGRRRDPKIDRNGCGGAGTRSVTAHGPPPRRQTPRRPPAGVISLAASGPPLTARSPPPAPIPVPHGSPLA